MSRKTFSDYKKSIDNDIRTIIHKGKNVACYKFPFFQTILEFAKKDITHITREMLAKPHVEKIVKHMKKSPFQGQTGVRNGKMLQSVKDHIDGKINMENLCLSQPVQLSCKLIMIDDDDEEMIETERESGGHAHMNRCMHHEYI